MNCVRHWIMILTMLLYIEFDSAALLAIYIVRLLDSILCLPDGQDSKEKNKK